MLVGGSADRAQVAILESGVLVETYVTKSASRSLVGNVYLGRVQNVLRGMEAAFVDIGQPRNAVLYIGEVMTDLPGVLEADVEGEAQPQGQRIDEVLQTGQSVLVQVTKDPMGTKGARLTTEVSLAGRYLVIVPRGAGHGISRRLDDRERQRLRDIAKRIRPDGYGVIVRTAAEGVDEDELARDVTRLTRLWEEIDARATKASAPREIYVEPDLVIRTVRDLFSRDYDALIIEDRDNYERVVSYLGAVAPELAERVALHSGPETLFDSQNVTDQLRKALERKVWLPSGGYIVIDRAEALTVIDVNTGRYVGKTSLEDTVVKTNLEAAAEVVRQLRLRDIGGIIIVDFIDMLLARNREQVLREFRRELLNDKTKTQVIGISPLGLVEMTRKNVSEGLVEALGTPCPTCAGRGVVIEEALHDVPHAHIPGLDAPPTERPPRDRPKPAAADRPQRAATAQQQRPPREGAEDRAARKRRRGGRRRRGGGSGSGQRPEVAPEVLPTDDGQRAQRNDRREPTAPTDEPVAPPAVTTEAAEIGRSEAAEVAEAAEPERSPLIRPGPEDVLEEPRRSAEETG